MEIRIKSDMNLPDDILRMSELFRKAGKDFYVVGGAVRDFVIGLFFPTLKKIPHDYDLVTNALPEESKKILTGWNVSDEQGKAFGVLRIYTESEPLGYELATYRIDISSGRDTKGTDKKVEIGNSVTIQDDCNRRDLKYNALLYDPHLRKVVDYVGGIEDIKNNIVSFVGNAFERIIEDRLRILRFVRFATTDDMKMDLDSYNAIKFDNRLKNVSVKEDVSQERIIEEWNKALEKSKSNVETFQRYIDAVTDFNLWSEMFPKLRIDTSVKLKSCFDNAIVFAQLIDENDLNNYSLLSKLKFPYDIYVRIKFLKMFGKLFSTENVFTLACEIKANNISLNVVKEYAEKVLNINIDSFVRYCEAGFVVDGNDLILKGFKGKEIGDEKRRLETLRYIEEFL